MGALEELKVLIVGSASGAVSAFKEAGTSAEVLEGKTAAASAEMKTLGTQGTATGSLLKAGIVGGAAVAGAALVKFATDGIQKFADLTAQTRSLRNVMGGTAEDASRIAAASRGLGLDVDTVSKGFFQLTKRIASNKDTLAQNGIEIARNNDHSVNMAKTLINVSEGYKAITDPAEKNLFLMQNFGKAGATLIPLLAQGKDKLAAFYQAAANHGEVFSEADLEKGRQYKIAMNELNQAWEGLSSTLGRELIPFVTQFARGLDVIITAIPGFVSDISNAFGALNIDPNGQFQKGLEALGITGSDTAKVLVYDVGQIQDAFAGLSSADAAQKFLDLGVDAEKAGTQVHQAQLHMENFVQIAKQDVSVGAQVIEGLKARGINTEAYERALKKVAGEQYDSNIAAQQLKDTNTLLTGSYEDQIKVLDKTTDALLATYDKDFAAIHATEALRTAVQDLTDKRLAAGEAGGQDAAANQAATDAMFAAEEQAIKTAAALGAKAEADHQADGAAAAHAASVYTQIGSLNALIQTLAPTDPLRVYLQQYIDKLGDPAINGVHAAGVTVDGLDEAQQKLDALLYSLLQISTQPWFVNVSVEGNAAAPHTG